MNYEKELFDLLDKGKKFLTRQSLKERKKKLMIFTVGEENIKNATKFKNRGKRIEKDLINKLRNKKFFLYGAGGAGVLFYKNFCEKYSLFPELIVDKLENWDENKLCFLGKVGKEKLLKASENLSKIPKNWIAIITVNKKFFQREIENMLQKSGFKEILLLPEELILWYYGKTCKLTWKEFYNNTYKYFASPKILNNFLLKGKELKKVLKSLEDEESKKVFVDVIKSFVFLQNIKTIMYPVEEQYFPRELSLDYNHFVDIGSWKGDTLIALHKFVGHVDTIYCFEPNTDCLTTLMEVINMHYNVANRILIFPLGVYSKKKILYLKKDFLGRGISKIFLDNKFLDSNSSESIYCLPLDTIFVKEKITFIKMDIEGAELEALKGARRIIKEQKPDLAICIYHHPDHFWQIPLFLKELVPEYKLYIRKYGPQFLTETVLYATI